MSDYYAIHKTKKNDELTHWKYIKKAKINGKWRYYYDTKDNKLTTLQNKSAEADYKYQQGFDQYYKNYLDEELKYVKNSKIREALRKQYENSLRKKVGVDDIYRNYDPIGKRQNLQAEDAYRAYQNRAKSIGGKVDKFMARNGYKIAKSLNKAGDAIEKGKKKVLNMFK